MEVLGAWVAAHEPLLTKELEKAEQTEHAAEVEVRSEEAKQDFSGMSGMVGIRQRRVRRRHLRLNFGRSYAPTWQSSRDPNLFS